jgi:SHS2 domain-containing protein
MASPSRIEWIEHTADTGFRVRAAALPELFSAAVAALVSTAIESSDVRAESPVPVAIEAADLPELLVALLNEVLFHLDARGFATARVDFTRLNENGLRATLWGEPRDPARHPPRLVVKAVTFHLLEVSRTPEGWQAQVVLDI